jgi:hypothetical protein
VYTRAAMVPVRIVLSVIIVSVVLMGCNREDRITQLEKRTQDLEEQIKKDNVVSQYDLAEKCSRSAKEWFKENWQSDQDTALLDYTNHYNKTMNKCFISVEYHYNFSKNDPSWMNDISLWDVNENSKYGDFSEEHRISFTPGSEPTTTVESCEVTGTKCKTLDEYNGLVESYLNN